MSRREEKVLTRLKFDIPDKDLRAAAAVLRAVRHMLESDHWRRLVKSIR
jgi:hypothetical protein